MTKRRLFADLIGRYEGVYVTQEDAKARGIEWPTIPQRLNNPGDLIYVGQRNAVPATIIGRDGKKRIYCQFPSMDVGWAECEAQIQRFADRGLTVQQAIEKWAPGSDGNEPASYAAFICHRLGCTPDQKLSEVISSPPE